MKFKITITVSFVLLINSLSTLGLLQPSNGLVIKNTDGTVTYTPNTGFQGTDEFEYRLCSIEYPSICDVALVTVRVSTCIANPNENLFRGKVFVEASPDDATYNGEMGAAGVQVDLYIDANCNGIIDIGEGITESTVSDIGGRYSFSTQDGNNARDNFDPTAAFNGNDGGLLWNNNWTESGDDGSFSSGDIRVTTDASTGGMGNAIRLSGPSNGISRSLTFNNTVSALLKFSYRRQSLDRQGEGVSVLINGTTVFTLNDGQAVGTDLNYTNVYLPLSAYNANGVNTLQFITNGSVSTDDYFWIDNVELSYYRNPPICYVAKVNTASTLGAYSPSLLDTQTATFNVLGVCDKDNYLGVIPHLVATDDNAFTTIDNAIDINVIQNEFLGKPDTSLVSFTGVSIVPAHGTVSVNQDGTIRYIPNPGYFGTDQFEYRVCSLEDSNVCDIALVNVTVSCASSPLSNAVTGTVFVDGNSNGLYGLGETGYVNAGVNLILDQNNNGVPNVGEPTVQTTLTDSTGYYEFHIDPPTNSLNYLDQFNFSGISNQSNGSTSWTNSWIKIGEGGTFSQNNIQISSSTGLQIQSSAGVVSGAYRSLNLNGALSATMSVSFNEQNLELEVNDYVDLQIANSASPSSWHLLKRFTGADGNQTGSISFDISDYISSATTIRFVTSGSTLMVPGDVIYFDNVQVDYLQPVAANYVVQLIQPIPTGYSLTTPLPNPTGYYAVAFASSGQGECNKNFGLAVTDLAVTKIVDNSTPYVGDTVTFTITATNNGPTAASNVVVSDVVPSGYNIVAAASSKGTWVGNSWNVGYMNNGDTENLQLTTRVVPSTGYINIANIAGDQADVFLTNNTDSASTNPTALIDLALDLSTSNANPNVGDVLTFTIDLTNADYSPATGIIVKSVIPNGFGSISSISDGGSIAGNEITWNLASLTNNNNNLLTYQATVLAPGSGVTYNTLAQVTAANELDFDSTPNNNVSSEDDQDTISVVPQVADLRLTNQISSILPNVGDVVTYTVTVYNDGPDAATNVDISNVIDNGFNTITNISGGGILTGNTIEWNIGSLLSGQSRTFTYQATVLAPGPGIGQTNIAQVSASDQFDPDSSPNNNLNTEDDQAEVTALLQGANLSLLKSINDSTPNIGDIVTFSIVLSNSGPDAATNVSIEDVIPNGYSLVSNISNSGILTGNTINWNIPNLSNGSNITLTYQATVNAPVFGINFTNTAQITASDQFDPNSTPSNDNPVEDDQSSVTSVPRVADLALTKSVNNPAPQVGEVVTFTIEIQNFGPDSANFVSVKDTIPNGYTNISNITGGGILTGNVINWNFANIPFGINQTVTYEATVLPPLPGVIYTNIAQVSASDEFDPNSTPNNNNFLENDQDGVTVDPKVADLSIIKQINNINPLAGDMVTFTITLSNSGPDTASNIVISDKIPNGYSGITNITGGGNFVGDSITWFVPSLAIGQNEVFTYQATVLQSGAGISHTNIVQVQSVNEYDPNSIPGNGNTGENDQDEVTAVPQQANLSLIKTSNTLLPDMGDTVTFFVKIKNAGPFAATNVYVRDSIPNGYSNIMNVSHSGTMVGSNLEWYIANIPNGDSVTVTYQIVVAEPDPGINFTNIAQITGLDQFDPNSTPGNNNPAEDDQSQVTLSPTEANISLVKTVSNIRPNVGDVITFILTLTNAGPDTATGIDVEDIMPNGYSNITNISHGGTRAANILHWNNLTIPNAGTLVLTYQATVLPIIAGRNYNNIAQLIGLDQHDPDSTPGNDNPAEDDQDEIIVSPRSSDISLVKVVSDANPNVGDTITYTVKVYNAGPDTATNIVAGDFLPNGLINIRNISASGVYAGDSIVWNIASIVPADSIVLTYQATVAAPGFGVTFNNIAQILDVDQFDPNSTPGNDNPAENDQDEITIVPQVANITLTKSVNNIRPNVGDVVTFTIALANAGPDTATGVAVEDIMPNGFNNIINISNGGLLSGSTINWTGLSVPANDTLLLTYQATVLPLLPGNNYNNIAQITDTDQHDPDSTPGNDNPAEDDQDEIIVSPRSSDISLVKVVSDANPNVGDTITYTVKVYNAGPDTATNIVAGDFLPNGLINIRNISASGVYAGDSIVWNIASIVPADSIVLTYQATVAAPGFGVSFNNIAQILDVDQFDPNSTPGNDNPAENDQDEITIVPQVANITLTKSVNNIRPNVGDVVTFTIALANVGPDTATGVAVEDIMPNGFNNIINISNGGLLSGSTINWTGLSVPANDTLLLTYQATVLPLLPGNNYNNIAQITDTDQHDPDSTPGNDNPAEDDQDEIIVSPRSSDISLVKVVSDANPNVGDTIIYTVKVYNAGPDTATNIVAGDFLPNGLTNIRNISASGVYAGDSIVWNIASIDPADSIVLTYQATVAAPGFGVTFNNIAQILDVDQYDPNSTPGNDNPAENDQDEITIVPQVANITLTKSVNNIRPNVEDVVTFTIALANAGPDTATGVAVEDIMPNGFNNTINISNGGLLSGSTINWTGLSVPANDTLLLTYQATVLPLLPGNNYNNIAQITDTDQHDPDSTPGNDNPAEDDQDEIIVSPRSSDISLVKVVSDANPNVGDTITYTVKIYNAGPDTATNIVAGDFLPNGLTNIRNISASGVYASDSIVWNIASIVPADSIVLTYQATVAAPGFGVTFNNIAQIHDVDQFDPNSTPGNDNPAENDQDEITIVPQVANITLTKSVNNIRPNVGDVVTFTIALANAGPDSATGVAVEDIMPNGFNNIINISNGGLLSGSTINWTGLSVPANDTILLTYQATVLPLLPGNNYNNIAQITDTDQHDPDSTPGNDNPAEDDQDEIIVSPRSSDISLVKVVSDANPNVGDTITYTVKIYNAGPDTATNIVAGDFLPNGLSNIRNISASGVYAGDSIVWNIASIVPADSIVLTYQATVAAPGFGVTFNNIAQILEVDQYDPNSTPGNDNPAENDQDEVNILSKVADISLVKTADLTTPIVGDTVNYTITIINAGPDTATNVAVNDIIPNGLGSIMNINNGGVLNISNINWNIVSIAANDTVFLNYSGIVQQPVSGVTYLNTAEITSSDQFDPNSTPGNGVTTEDDYDEQNLIVDSSVPVANAGADFNKTCIINPSGRTIGEASQVNHSYSWYPSTGLSDTTISNPVANPLVTTTYYVTKTNLNNLFFDVDTITVTVNTTIPSISAGADFTISCSQNPTGNFIGEVSQAGHSYAWTPSSGLSSAVISRPMARPSVTTTYYMSKTRIANGCVGYDTITVTVDTLKPIAAISGIDTITCAKTSVMRVASGGVTYAWSDGLGTNDSVNISSPGTYNVTVTATNGCTSTASVEVFRDIVVPVVNISGMDTLFVTGQTVARVASGASTYSWSAGLGTSDSVNISIPGTYTVTGTALNGCTATASTTVLQMIYGSIGDQVWRDDNQNGKFDLGESGLPNVKLYLADTSGIILDSVLTDSNGKYLFDSLLAGEYLVKVQIPSGFIFTNNNSVSADSSSDSDFDRISGFSTKVTVSAAYPRRHLRRDNTEIDAGFIKVGTIRDMVWEDTNRNGIKDSTETGISGVTVRIYDYSNNLISSKTTDSTGNFEFDSLTIGQYYVSFVKPLLYEAFTLKNQGLDSSKDSDVNVLTSRTDLITISSAGNEEIIKLDSADAGLMLYEKSIIGDFVWNDLNGNGIQEIGEPGLDSINVTLTGITYLGDTININTLTDSLGKYYFTNIDPGTYQINVDQPSGFAFAPENQEITDSLDSDIINAFGDSSPIVITGGQNLDNVDAAQYQFSTLSGIVWNDDDRDGLQVLTESPMPNTTVYLTGVTGSGSLINLSTISDSNGLFNFDSLAPGQYSVSILKPSGFVYSPTDSGSDDNLDSDINAGTGISTNYTITSGEINNSVGIGIFAQIPEITLVKTGILSGKGFVGDTINYTFTVTNTGENTLRNIYIIDSLLNASPITLSPDSLLAGQSGTATGSYILTPTDIIRGSVSNSAIVYGTDPEGDLVSDISDDNNPANPGLNDTTVVTIPKVDFALSSNIIGTCEVAIGDTVTYQVVVIRQDTMSLPSAVIISDSLPSTVSFVSATTTNGTFNSATGVWDNLSLSSGQSDTLTIRARVLTQIGGLMCNIAYIDSSEYNDVDSNPGNQVSTEDDYTKSCKSLPINICVSKGETTTLSTTTGHTTYQWQRNGVDIPGANTSSVTISAAGDYTVIIDGQACISGCCPIIVQDSCYCPPAICVPLKITKTR
ncbi:MAG: DUF11 domain-containing protein [Cytophagaceae bacterium]|nr:DUF11 domain-containing protein [Cytophagaceae bacterium]